MLSKPGPRARWTRLRSMRAGEICDRARQEISKRIDLARYSLHAAPRARIAQPHKVPQFFFAPQQLPELAALVREKLPDQANDIIRRAERICAHRFDLLGYEELDYGLKIDWHLDRVHGKRAPQKPWYKIRYLDFAEVGDVKIIWELSRHQQLVTLAKAYVLTKDERFAKEILSQWYDWNDQNPYPIGVNWASSLEVAFRAVSWLWVKHLLAGSTVITQQFEDDLSLALALSGRHVARYLSTYFSPNTHLLGEGVGLFFLGVHCPELSDAPKWQRLGWKIVLDEAERQVRPDGMHFEQSNYYHVYALDMFLHCALLAARNGIAAPERFERTLEKMLDAILLMSQAGISPRFGDDDGGRFFDHRRNRAEHMLDPLAAGAVLFGRGDFKSVAGGLREETIWLVGAEGVARYDQLAESVPKPHSAAFPESGFYVMAGLTAGKPSQLIIDAGPQGAIAAGHGHADALSIQLSNGGNELLVDPGTCEYVGNQDIRNQFRGTAAHNSVQIDGRDQPPPMGPFSWEYLITCKVSSWVEGESFDLFAGSYETLDGLVHRRDVVYCKPEFWLVHDVIEGTGKHPITTFWHLAPGMTRKCENPAYFFSSQANIGLGIISSVNRDWEITLGEDWWSPVYGRKEPAQTLQFSRETLLPVEIATVLATTADVRSLGRLNRIEASAEPSKVVQGYAYSIGDEVHRLFFARDGGEWSLQNWSSDAEFLYCREDRSGVKLIAMCGGKRASFAGRPVLSAPSFIKCCEVTASAKRILSKQPGMITLHGWPEIKSKLETRSLETAKVEN
jgi:Heparinase II/III-like protein/Heparinase II/III N-terminus